MAHKIMGTDYMASVRETPWHGIGAILEEVATAEEMITAARLGWTVEKEPCIRLNAQGVIETVPNEYWTIRQDTDRILGRVGKDYNILQNHDTFALMDCVTMDKGGPKYETAGSLRDGKTVWALLRLPGFIEVTKTDHIHEYILIMNTHDGTKAVTVLYTSVRVVCNNTLNAALESGNLFSMRHSSQMMTQEKQANIRNFLGIVNTASEKFVEQVTALQSVTPTKKQVDDVLSKLFAPVKGETSTRSKNVQKDVETLIYDGEANRLAGVTGNAWDVLNGITEYIGYSRTVRTSIPSGISEQEEIKMRNEARLESSFFGDGNKLKDKALNLVLALTK